MTFYVYVLKSKNTNHFYTGFTSDLNKRLLKHNSGKVKWTSRYLPWETIYYETFSLRNEALKREHYLKSNSGRKWLKEKFENNAGS